MSSSSHSLHYNVVPGLPPGTLRAPEDALVADRIQVMQFNAEQLFEYDCATLAEALELRLPDAQTWLNINGLGNIQLLHDLGNTLNIHPLALEDALNTRQRIKTNQYEGHIYVCIKMLHWDEQGTESEQISLFLKKDLLVTLQERPGDCLDAVRFRLRRDGSRLRSQGTDYLLYAVLDAIIDHYFPWLEYIGDKFDILEEEVTIHSTSQLLTRIHALKGELMEVRRSLWPLRDVLSTLERDESGLIRRRTRPYLRDCQDHCMQILETLDTYREYSNSLMDLYLSGISNRMNEIMKVLTIISTVFIPISFVGTVYGMNFEHMPELKWRWGYVACLILMFLIAALMLGLFRYFGWFGGERTDQHQCSRRKLRLPMVTRLEDYLQQFGKALLFPSFEGEKEKSEPHADDKNQNNVETLKKEL
ncbi:MAG: magnesium/cobalt transporter CorA [Oligosphaeraceae bacterium]|nr:magnesium/cobalt transporter CorA [Oligosphaeraceae bacterium]